MNQSTSRYFGDRLKTYVVSNCPSLGAMRWPRMWRDAVVRSRNQRFGYNTWHPGGVCAWKYGMMKIRLGKIDFRRSWQGSGCNKSIREASFYKYPETEYGRLHFNVDITRRLKHSMMFRRVIMALSQIEKLEITKEDWRTACAWGDGPSVGS